MQGLALLGILINYLWKIPNLEEEGWERRFQRLKLDRKSCVMMIKTASSQTHNKCKMVYLAKKKPRGLISPE